METTSLITYDGEKKWIMDNYNDDSSSGYDSAESWDTDSLSSRDGDTQSLPPCDSDSKPLSSCDIERDFTRCCKIEPEVMKISSTTNLCESLDLILSMPDMCDVTFLVGAEEIPVHGLKAVLSVRSRVFHHLIIKHQHMPEDVKKVKRSLKSMKKSHMTTSGLYKQRLLIPVRKYDSEVFRMMIQFVHTGSAYITDENVSGLLCGAMQFELTDLADACWEHIHTCVKSGRGESLLTPTRAYIEHKTSQLIFDRIYQELDKRFVEVDQP